MKTLSLAAVAALALALSARAEDRVRYEARPGSKMKIEGTSTIHDWSMEGQIIGGYFEVPAGVTLDASQAAPAGLAGGKLAAQAESSVPIRSLKSGHKGMDEVMQQAMNATAYPKIVYHLSEMTLKTPHAAGTPLQFDTKGELSMNGVTNVISLPVTIENVDKMKLKVSGSTSLKMSAFKIKPPAPKIALGMVSTGDDVKVSFEWTVALPEKAAGN